ncbi:hypothetical protein BHM03_00011873 [Ensete ventricosum]|nr:hypothetical protein BHM03_00011873 [Ensete ventricosum]
MARPSVPKLLLSERCFVRKLLFGISLTIRMLQSYLHSQKIVHRDVKTENMLLDGRGNLKIADFGVARVEAQNPKDMTGQTGTLGYMAPENLRPQIPRCCPRAMASIMRKCWDADPDKRPDMDEVVGLLLALDTSKGGGMIPEDEAQGCWCLIRKRGP